MINPLREDFYQTMVVDPRPDPLMPVLESGQYIGSGLADSLHCCETLLPGAVFGTLILASNNENNPKCVGSCDDLSCAGGAFLAFTVFKPCCCCPSYPGLAADLTPFRTVASLSRVIPNP